MIVGGGHRGVVLSANYLARAVRRPLGDADDPGPPAVPAGAWWSRPTTTRSRTVSASVMEIFRQVTPLVEALSLDEAFLDVRGVGAPARVAGARSPSSSGPGSHDEQGITCSVGVAATVVGRQAGQPAGQARRRARGAAGGGDHASCTRSPSRSCGGWGRRPPSSCTGSGCITVGDVAHTPLRDPAAGARAGHWAASCTSSPGARTAGS